MTFLGASLEHEVQQAQREIRRVDEATVHVRRLVEQAPPESRLIHHMADQCQAVQERYGVLAAYLDKLSRIASDTAKALREKTGVREEF